MSEPILSTVTSPMVSATTVDLTPTSPVALFGFEARHGEYTAVRTRLEANIMTLSSPDSFVHLVSIDALYGGEIHRRLVDRLGLAPENVLVCGSHTHFAPGVDGGLPRLGPTDCDYLDAVVEKIARAIEKAEPTADGGVSWATGTVSGLFTNRRRPVLGLGVRLPRLDSVLSAPHRRGHVDDELRAVMFSASDVPIAVLWGVSCHPVCTPTIGTVSADFPGEVRAAIRGVHGQDLPVLFLQGFGADICPLVYSRRPPAGPKQLLYYLASGCIRFVEQVEPSYTSWCEQLGRSALNVLERCPSALRPLAVSVSRVEADTPAGWARTPMMQRIQVARGCSIVAVNAEVVHERVAEVSTIAGEELTIPASCCNQVFGYWPTDQMVHEGGYEADGSQRLFPDLDSLTSTGADRLWHVTLKRLFEAGTD